MIMNEWFQSVYPPVQPRSNAVMPQTELFRSTRGHLISIRLVAPGDSGRIADLLAGLSAQSLFLRYCMPMPRMAPEMVAREAARLGQAHSPRQLTVVALLYVGGMEQVIAVAELARDASSPAEAEIALVVADAYQREGIGSALIAHLMTAARRHGISTLHATALADNVGVRRMVARSGTPYTSETRQGMTTIQIDLSVGVGGWGLGVGG
jgi:GNAT superfamily N-acetyltransferase